MNIDNITSDSMSLSYNGKEMLIKVYEQEIKRLKEELSDEIDDELKQSEIMVKQQKEIERLNSVIKEVREYIKQHTENIDRGRYYEDYVETYPILEILDKEEE